jgi:hypothetical protein
VPQFEENFERKLTNISMLFVFTSMFSVANKNHRKLVLFETLETIECWVGSAAG